MAVILRYFTEFGKPAVQHINSKGLSTLIGLCLATKRVDVWRNLCASLLFYRSANAIFSKSVVVWKHAHWWNQIYCLLTLSSTASSCMKLLKTNNIDVVKTCQQYFNFEIYQAHYGENAPHYSICSPASRIFSVRLHRIPFNLCWHNDVSTIALSNIIAECHVYLLAFLFCCFSPYLYAFSMLPLLWRIIIYIYKESSRSLSHLLMNCCLHWRTSVLAIMRQIIYDTR